MTVPEVLTSQSNPRVKAAVRLRDRREREATGLTIVDGVRELGRALDAGIEVVEAFVADAAVSTDEARDVIGRLAGTVGLTQVSEPVLEKIAFGDRSDGIVAIVRTPPTDLARLDLPPEPLLVVIEAVEKPGNLGAILRSADGAGVDAVIAADPRTDLFNPNAIRASLGTIFALPVAAGTSAEVRAWLDERGIAVLAARVGSSVAYTQADLRGAIALVLGSEADGLTEAWTGDGVTSIALPMHGIADSLNVSITAAVLLYEAGRQRA